MAIIQCPQCNNKFNLPEIIIKKVSNFICPRCKHQWNLQETCEKQPVQQAKEEKTEKEQVPFKHTVTITRLEDDFDFYFFTEESSFGRYDSSILSEVMIQTNDLSISRRHLIIFIEAIDGGYKAHIKNKSKEGVCLVNGKQLPYDEQSEIRPGMNLTLGKTRFIIKDINTNKE